MHIHEDIMLLLARQRTEEALRFAEQRRALRLARARRRPVRVRLGVALVQLGHWIMGQSYPVAEERGI